MMNPASSSPAPTDMAIAMARCGIREKDPAIAAHFYDRHDATEANRAGAATTVNPDPDAEWGHDPHIIDICRSQPTTLYAVAEGREAGVYRSDDAGASWQLVAGYLPRIISVTACLL